MFKRVAVCLVMHGGVAQPVQGVYHLLVVAALGPRGVSVWWFLDGDGLEHGRGVLRAARSLAGSLVLALAKALGTDVRREEGVCCHTGAASGASTLCRRLRRARGGRERMQCSAAHHRESRSRGVEKHAGDREHLRRRGSRRARGGRVGAARHHDEARSENATPPQLPRSPVLLHVTARRALTTVGALAVGAIAAAVAPRALATRWRRFGFVAGRGGSAGRWRRHRHERDWTLRG